jgi:ribosomal protein S18 acetylase RimI-like enzyme
LVEEARRLGVRALHLEVEPDNEAGVALYLSEGFGDRGRQLYTRRLGEEGR